MLKKKRNLLFGSCLVGLLATTSATGVALASCSSNTTSSSSSSDNVQYSYVIDWNNKDIVDRLIIDNDGLVYSDNSMTTIIAVSPKVKLTTIKIPSRVKGIMGYSRVMYKSSNGTLYDQVPTGQSASSYTKVYVSYGAFEGMESLETVTLEAGSQLQSVGGAAFSNCVNLKNITNLSNSLKYIGISAFANCINLQGIDISNVEGIGDSAFSGCTNLKNISGSSKSLKYIGANSFRNCTSLQAIDISSVVSIGDYAFYGCTILDNVAGSSKSLLSIGVGSFYNCANLKTIDLLNVTKINNYAFYGCTGLSTVDLSNVLSIGDYAFQNCSSLTSLGSLEKVNTIGQYAFASATKSGSGISLKLSKLSVVSGFAFSGAQGITTVDFSDNTALTAVGDQAFANSSVTEADFSGCSNLTKLGYKSFTNCVNLTTILLPNNDVTSLTTFEWQAFSNCAKLTNVAPKGSTGFVATNKLTTIGANTFAYSGITKVDLSNFVISSSMASTTPLGSAVSLAYIPNLSSVTLPNTLTTINAGLFYNSGNSSTGGFSLDLPSSITNIEYKNSMSMVEPNTNAQTTVSNINAFTNSGITSIDMSKIAGYQTSNANAIPDYLFNGATKLTSVVLKSGTTTIGNYAFKDTTALTSITYSTSSNADQTTNTTNGFTASSTLTSIGTNAFENAFSDASNAVIDLTAITTNLSLGASAFKGSKITTVNLPASTTTIPASSFDNMTKLSSVNFGALTKLTSIVAPNFNNTKLTSIDLSNVTISNFSSLFNNVTAENKLFTGLPTGCVVSLPITAGSFTEDIFLDSNSKPVYFSYPNGILFNNSSSGISNGIGTVSNGIFSFVNASDPRITNIKDINISNSDTVLSIGPNTFFGKSKLNSVTLSAKGISNKGASLGLFSTTSSINVNNSNTTNTTEYTQEKMPFGNNTLLTTLNYTGFTTVTNPTGTTDKEKLYNSTDQITWAEIAKIMNSLSFQSTDGANAAPTLKPNVSQWVIAGYNSGSNTMNPDITNYKDTSNNKDMVLTNLYNTNGNNETGSAIHFNASTSEKSFFHNGVNWTYTNDGSAIKLVGKVNMYRLTKDSSNQYLVYFNQVIDSPTGSDKSYYIPGSTVTVTLTVATKTSS